MPLQDTDTPRYLRRYRVYVDSKNRVDPGQFGNNDYRVNLGTTFQNVVGIELVGWRFPSGAAPTWVGRYSSEFPLATLGTGETLRGPGRSNNVLDIRVSDVAGLPQVTFSADVEFDRSVSGGNPSECLKRHTSAGVVAEIVQSALTNAFTALGTTSSINSTNTTIDVQDDGAGRIAVCAFETATPANNYAVTLLFRTGRNRQNSMANVLGFRVDRDTEEVSSAFLLKTGSAVAHLWTKGDYAYNSIPFRHVDVSVSGGRALELVARVPLARPTESTSPYELVPNAVSLGADRDLRILTEPVRRMRQMRVRLDLDGHIAPSVLFHNHQLVFEITTLAQEVDVPSWIRQRLAY